MYTARQTPGAEFDGSNAPAHNVLLKLNANRTQSTPDRAHDHVGVHLDKLLDDLGLQAFPLQYGDVGLGQNLDVALLDVVDHRVRFPLGKGQKL